MSCIEHFPLTLWLALFCENAEGLKRMTIVVKYLGLSDYQETYDAMREFTKNRNAKTPDEIWLLEHTPVFTLGLAGDPSNLHSPSNQIPLMQADRGGEITYHGPGQIIGYVLMDIRRKNLGIRTLVQQIEQLLIAVLDNYKIKATVHPGAPGVYVDDKKIASIGLRVKQGCTYHGFALNVNMDLTPFNDINPCGFNTLKMTQMSDYIKGIRLNDVLKKLEKAFNDYF